MERLLAHPADLPLVHVDHSHRAPAVRTTGQCYRVINSNPIHASGHVYRDGVRIQTFTYTLDELDCDTKGVKASKDQAEKVFGVLRTAAGWYQGAQRIVMEAATNEPMPLRPAYLLPHDLPLATIDAAAETIVWLDVMGGSMTSLKTAPDYCMERLAAFLTKEHAKELGPRFNMQNAY